MRTGQTNHISELANQLVNEYKKFNQPVQMDGFKIDKPNENLVLDKILDGNRANSSRGLTINSFERINFVKMSKCINSKKSYFQCLGYRSNFDEVYFIVLKQKNNV